MQKFEQLLWSVNRAYEDYVRGVVAYISIPGNEGKRQMIEKYINSNPNADSADVLEYMISDTDFFDKVKEPNLEVLA